jgi:hypothetical protein
MSDFMRELMFVDRPDGRSTSVAKIDPKYDQAELQNWFGGDDKTNHQVEVAFPITLISPLRRPRSFRMFYVLSARTSARNLASSTER